MKASPLAVFLTIVIILLVVIPGLSALLPQYADGIRLTPQGSFIGVRKASSTTEKVFFDSFSGPIEDGVKPSDIKIVIENQSATQASTYTMPTTDLSGALTSWPGGTLTGVGSIAYTDLAQDKKISNQDYITMTFGFPGSGSVSYKVSMIYVWTDSVIDSITFYW